jgi:threonine dehydratase
VTNPAVGSAPAGTRILPSLAELERASAIVREVVPATPQQRWPLLDARAGAEVWVKHENHTPVGAFKVRGGVTFFHELAASGAAPAGVVTATRGNHGQSVGLAAVRAGIKAAVVVPRGNSTEKNSAMRALGVELIEHGSDFQEALERTEVIARERGWFRFPAFHPWLVRGVGTYALEFFRGAPPLDTVYVPIGLGSGLCGVIAARDALGLKTEIVGVVSAHAPAYARSLTSGSLVSAPVTTILADGMACRTPLAEALDTMRGRIARTVEVTDAQVAQAMRAIFSDTHNVAEGAGAAPLAALLAERDAMRGRRVGIVISGGNVDRDLFARVLGGWDPVPAG